MGLAAAEEQRAALTVGNGTWVHPGHKQDQPPQLSCLWPGNLPLLACSQLELQESLDSSCTLPVSRLPFMPLPLPIPAQFLTCSGQFRDHFLQEAFLGSFPFRAVKWPSGLSNTLLSPLSHLSPCIVGTCFLGGLGFPVVLAHSRY